MGNFEDLRVRQLDEGLAPFKGLRHHPPPNQGWVKAIREALGMSTRQLAERVGLSKTAIRGAEASEARGTVQLDTLRTLAQAMDCDVVYALVPRASLGDTLDRQAERKALGLVSRVSDSMELEAQHVRESAQSLQVDELKAGLLRDRGRRFWDV